MCLGRRTLFLLDTIAFPLMTRCLLDAILPTVLPAVFHAEKRFLCAIAYEVLEALVAHCSGRKLVLLLLQHGADASAKRDDMRLFNLVTFPLHHPSPFAQVLGHVDGCMECVADQSSPSCVCLDLQTSVYVEKCFMTMNAAEIQHLMTRSCAATMLHSLARLLVCKSSPTKIAAQKTLAVIQGALGVRDLCLNCGVWRVSGAERVTTNPLSNAELFHVPLGCCL